MILVALIHDLGKMMVIKVIALALIAKSSQKEPQYAVVGDTFPVGCRFSDKIIFHEFFEGNPDSLVPTYQTDLGIYSQNCGLNNVHMS